MAESYDVIIVGGGHNGLVCAALLAKAGRRVVLLEAAEELGGGARTVEFAPGFKASNCAHILHLLHPQVMAEIDLAKHGLAFAVTDMASIALAEDGKHLTFSSDGALARTTLRHHSAADAEAFPHLQDRLQRFAFALQPLLAKVPPRLAKGTLRDRMTLMNLGWSLRRLGRDDLREFLRVIAMNVADLLEDELESDLLRGALAFDAVLGTHLGPRSPNSLLTLLYRMAGEVDGRRGALALPKGGMGAVTAALASAARGAGAELKTESPVARVLVDNDRACGVALASGEEIRSRLVVSNADPKRTFLDLLGTEHLDAGFVRKVDNIRMRGNVAKLSLALDELPTFTGLDTEALGERLLIAPSIDYVECAFNAAKYGDFSPAPAIEITLPTVHDAELAPAGKHVLSALVQYAPYRLKQGWDSAREHFAALAIDTIAAYAPGLRDRIVAHQILTPLDLERETGMTGGHWHHGELAIDQMLMLRPVPGAAQYATPLPGLYLCGAGAHPGGGIMGAAGMNAAKQIIAKEAVA